MSASNILVACIVTTVSFGITGSTNSYLGKDFVFGILPSFREGLSPKTKVTLEIGSKEAGFLTLDVPKLGISGTQYTLQAKGYLKIELNHTIQYFGSVQDIRSVSIQSSTDISVLVTYVFQGCCGMASYRVYAVDVLGKHYIADSYAPTVDVSPDFFSYLMVVAVKNKTHVVLNNNNGVINTTLDAAELYQYRFPQTQNLTGTTISASENIAVFSGSGFSEPHGYSHGAPMMSQMIPSSAWSHTFVAAEGEPSGALMIRHLSDNTSVKTNIVTSTSTQLSNGDGADNIITSSTTMLTSATPMEVIQYNGEFMTIVPGVSQYMNEYSFVLPVVDYTQLIHHLVAIVPTQHKDGIMLDGVKFVGSEKNLITPYGNFTTIQRSWKSVLDGFHEAKHSNPAVKFGLLAFGNSGVLNYRYTYGFYVGMTFEVSPTQTPSAIRTTTTLTTTSIQVQHGSRLCYSCQDMDQLQYCNVIRNCSADEVCYVKQILIGGVPMYSSGCTHSDVCDVRSTTSSSQNTCMECCSEDFCNHRGCGDIGLPPRSQRGPLCFDCDHISYPSRCSTLMLCDKNECTKTMTSTEISDIDVRSMPVRHSCCGTDFCNRNISHLDTGFIGSVGIIG